VRIFIAGATGVLGRAMIGQFVGRGHTVVGLVRSPEGEQLVQSLGGESRQADFFDADALARAAEGSEVVVHAATSIPTKTRTKPSDWEMNDRLRRDGTRALTDCAAKTGAGLYLQQSIVWLARPEDGSFFDEDSKPNPDPITQSALDAERIALEAGERNGFKTSVLRCGYFYGPDSAHTRMFGAGLMKRKIPVVGSGHAVLANLHTDDAASAFVTAAEGDRSGLWHVVDDESVAMEQFLSSFAERLGAPKPRRVPVWLARLIAGSYATSFFTSSTRTSNARFRREFGWRPLYPSYKEGLDQIVSTWQKSSPFKT
jgi:nucleoside-diphosphate-sugar epimerase